MLLWLSTANYEWCLPYSLYGHIVALAEAEARGIFAAGGKADIFQRATFFELLSLAILIGKTNHVDYNRIEETLSEEVPEKMHAPSKPIYPIIEPNQLLGYDAVLLGVPTRFGNSPVQWKAVWDKTGGIWNSGDYWGKYASLFVYSGTPGGGQESTALAAMSTLVHHRFIYISLGYQDVFALLSNTTEVYGGSPWGAGTFVVRDPHIVFGYVNILILRPYRVLMVLAFRAILNSKLLKHKARHSTKLPHGSATHFGQFSNYLTISTISRSCQSLSGD